MTISEATALTQYIEFSMVNMCERMEKHIEADAVDMLYEDMYNMLTDIDETLHNYIHDNIAPIS